jgi:hypothetical protein
MERQMLRYDVTYYRDGRAVEADRNVPESYIRDLNLRPGQSAQCICLSDPSHNRWIGPEQPTNNRVVGRGGDIAGRGPAGKRIVRRA